MLSRSTAGVHWNGDAASVSDDRRYVVFESYDAIEVGDSDSLQDIWLRDRQLGTAALVSPDADGYSYTAPGLSRSGRHLTYRLFKVDQSATGLVLLSGLVIDDLQSSQDFRFEFVFEVSGTQKRQCMFPRISGDGLWVEVGITDLAAPAQRSLRRYSTLTGQSAATATNHGNGQPLNAEALSFDGRFSVFQDGFSRAWSTISQRPTNSSPPPTTTSSAAPIPRAKFRTTGATPGS